MKRTNRLEILDTGEYTKEEYNECLNILGRIGKELGGDRATFKMLDDSYGSILDVGCGGGQFTCKLGERYPNAKVIGADIADDALEYATGKPHPENVSFCKRYDEPVDLLTCTLMCHHLTDEEIVAFLKEAKAQAKQVVINDLHRHPLAWLLFGLVAPIRFRNRLILHDGLLSVRRAFTRKDWIRYLEEAGITHYSITWSWPFRWIVKFALLGEELQG